MIIEIKDLPPGVKVSSIECKVKFCDDGAIVTDSSVTTVNNSVATDTPQEDRPENIAPEMQDLEF